MKNKIKFNRPGVTNRKSFKVSIGKLDEETGLVTYTSETVKIPDVQIPKLKKRRKKK